MKSLSIALLLLISSVNITGAEKEKRRVTFPKTPANTPEGSAIIPRTPERASFDSVFEPKNRSNCSNHCTCFECLDKACCELEKIQSKLPYLELTLNNAKKNKDGKSANEAVTAARMMAKIMALYKESEKLELVSKQGKDESKSEKKNAKDEKKSKKEKSDPNLKKSSSSRGHRLATPSDKTEGEEFNQLTGSNQDNIRWRLQDAGLI